MGLSRAMVRKASFGTPPVDFTTDLVASYQFESSANDFTGNHNATATGGSYLTAKVNDGIDLSGVSEYVTIPDHNDFSFTDGVTDLPFSLAFWFKADAIGASKFILWKGDNGSNREYRLFQNSTLGVKLQLITDSSNDISITRLASDFTAGVWYHMVYTYDGSETKEGLKQYKDGVDVTTAQLENGTYTGMVNSALDVTIGSRTDTPNSNEFDGKFDEWKFYKNRVLTQTEITEMYNLENAGTSVL